MIRNLQRTNLASSCLFIFLYVQIYTGIHQYHHPLESAEDFNTDLNFDQVHDTHHCEICDFQLTIHHVVNDFSVVCLVPNLAVKHALPSEPFSEITKLSLSRAPPGI